MKNIILLIIITTSFIVILGFKWLSDNIDKKYEKYHISEVVNN